MRCQGPRTFGVAGILFVCMFALSYISFWLIFLLNSTCNCKRKNVIQLSGSFSNDSTLLKEESIFRYFYICQLIYLILVLFLHCQLSHQRIFYFFLVVKKNSGISYKTSFYSHTSAVSSSISTYLYIAYNLRDSHSPYHTIAYHSIDVAFNMTLNQF